jgi:hypothetical protein
MVFIIRIPPAITVFTKQVSRGYLQKIVRKNPRDIKAILDKADPGRSSSLSVHTRVYQMFVEGSTPTEVAIALNLREGCARYRSSRFWCVCINHLSCMEWAEDDSR